MVTPFYIWISGRAVVPKNVTQQFSQDLQVTKTALAVSESSLLLKSQELSLLLSKNVGMQEKSLEEITILQKVYQSLQIEYEILKETRRADEEKYASQKIEVEKIEENFRASFRNLANEILEERSQKFDDHQKTSLKHILEPLQKEMETFKKDFTDKFNKESTERISLGFHIKNMMDMSNQLSDQANHLTQALRGQVKQQGNWGEAILESILEFAGLQKGVQYFVQESQHNEEGNRIQPDVRVQYPDNRHIIIDSKVSLIHYERFSNADTQEEKEKQLIFLLGSLKSHIQDLSSKNYQDHRENTLDFVMMFIPVEGAFITAMQHDRELWQYAYKKRILLISPTNLIAAMKLVQDFWQKDQNHKNSEEIASKAAGLYDKLVGFVETFEKIGDTLEKVGQSYAHAKKQLSTGQGNVISKAAQMKRLNNMKTTKSLPRNLVANALFEDGFDEEEKIES